MDGDAEERDDHGRNGGDRDVTDARWSALRRRIEDRREVLVRQGSLVRKQRRGQVYWYLRYFAPDPGPAKRKQCSLYVGQDADAQRVRALLNEIRASAICMAHSPHNSA